LRERGLPFREIARIVCGSERHVSQVKDWCNRIEQDLKGNGNGKY